MPKPAMYQRTTRESSYDHLNPAIRQAIEAHIETYELGSITAEVLACIETTSTQQKKGMLGRKSNPADPDMENVVAALVTPGWFIWGRVGDKSKPVVMTARIDNLEVLPYQWTAIADDHGVHITALWTDTVRRSQMFMGLGTESAAEEFKQILKDAVEKTHSRAE
jgi:hypothetical protein